jgi:hypothetical protein
MWTANEVCERRGTKKIDGHKIEWNCVGRRIYRMTLGFLLQLRKVLVDTWSQMPLKQNVFVQWSSYLTSARCAKVLSNGAHATTRARCTRYLTREVFTVIWSLKNTITEAQTARPRVRRAFGLVSCGSEMVQNDGLNRAQARGRRVLNRAQARGRRVAAAPSNTYGVALVDSCTLISS